MENDYISVTEIAGDDVTWGQIDRLRNRYYWTGSYCKDKDVLEVACGIGPGLGYLVRLARSLEAGDYSETILKLARQHYKERIPFLRFNAQAIPYKSKSKDVIIIFEAIYYLPDFEEFIGECVRVLRSGGKLLIATANKDLYDFNPSPYSRKYYGVVELNELLIKAGFRTDFFGDSPVNSVTFREKVLRPVKRMAVILDLIPKTMSGKRLLKKIVFGKLMKMPTELMAAQENYSQPDAIDPSKANFNFKVVFCAATLVKP